MFQNLDILRRTTPEYVLILAGDHVYKMDYGKLLAFHSLMKADMTVACIEVPLDDAGAFGVMGVDAESRVVDLSEKPAHPAPMPSKLDHALASMGVYVFNARFLYERLIRDADDPRSSHDFGKDIIPHLVSSNYRVYAQNFEASCVSCKGDASKSYWRDVGTDRFLLGSEHGTDQIEPDLNMYDKEWPIWTFQEQLPPAKFVFNDEDRGGRPWIRWCPGVASSAARRYAARCCSPTCTYTASPELMTRSSCPTWKWGAMSRSSGWWWTRTA